MKKVGIVDKVSRIDKLDNKILIGHDSLATKGQQISHGNQVFIYSSGTLSKELSLKHFYFIPFNDGILYYENEGAPIYYSDFNGSELFANEGCSFNPLQVRSNRASVLITFMDESFNQTHYIYKKDSNKLLPKFSSLLLDDSYVCTTTSSVELYSYANLELQWEYHLEQGKLLDRRNKPFNDKSLLYLPIKGGALMAIDTSTGNQHWKWQGDAEYVSYGESGKFIYVHAGHCIIVVSKVNGQIEKRIDYSDYEELNSFRSNGIIWCFDELIVVRNSGNGEVVLFDRESFKIKGRQIVDESGIAESKDRIRFVDNYLYILGISSTVHIYKVD